MSEITLAKVIREVTREWLMNNHSRLVGVLDAAALAAGPIIQQEVRDGLLRMATEDVCGETQDRYRETLEETGRSLQHLLDHGTWAGKDDLRPIAEKIAAALKA